MQRRDFSKTLAATGLGASMGAGLGLAGPAVAQGKWEEGVHYVRLQTPAPVSVAGGSKQVEVVEFFHYGCPHCDNFEPLLESWAKRLPPDVSFRQLPVGFSAPVVNWQRLYYALEELGALPTLHRRVFAAIHQQGRRLNTEADIVAFVAENGVDKDRFTTAFKSFGVNTKASRAKALSEAYKIDGVPAVGIHGRFYTGASMTGSHERALQATDFLIQRVRSGG